MFIVRSDDILIYALQNWEQFSLHTGVYSTVAQKGQHKQKKKTQTKKHNASKKVQNENKKKHNANKNTKRKQKSTTQTKKQNANKKA